MKKIFAFISLMSFAIAAQSQVLESRQMTLGDEQITVVWYSFKCYVAKGEGTKVRFFDAGGNVVVTACRTGGGSEPAFYTFSDGTVKPAFF